MSLILFKHFVRVTTLLLGVGALLIYMVAGGRDGALGVLVGGGIIFVSGSGLIFGISNLLDPTTTGKVKSGLGLMLVHKFMVVIALLYMALEMGVDLLGLMAGMGLGLTGLTLGVSWATQSKEGQDAIAAAEARIARDLAEAAEDDD